MAGKYTYSAEELYALELRPAFIRTMASGFDLTFIKNPTADSNLCFAENKEVRPEYRTTFDKRKVVKYIFTHFSGEVIDIEAAEVKFLNSFTFK